MNHLEDQKTALIKWLEHPRQTTLYMGFAALYTACVIAAFVFEPFKRERDEPSKSGKEV
jgi:hypothetical protein